jgi:vitamin K-dependent gamma-carboxylase-like protein
MKRWIERLRAFLFAAETDAWVTVLRVGFSLQVLAYALSLRSDWNDLFGGSGEAFVGRVLPERLLTTESPFIPRLAWLVDMGKLIGLSETTIFSITWWLLLLAASFLLAGLFCRWSAILTWFLYLCAAKSAGFTAYGVDNFTTIGLFYLMLSPLPDRYSLDRRFWRLKTVHPRLLGFFRRVLQIHLCLIYFFGGLAKILGSGWWNGSNLWRSLIRPPFNSISPEILVHFKYLFPIAGIAVCLLELSYPFLIWNRTTRRVWLVFICGMHLAIGLAMGMYLFAFVMIVLNLAAFGPPLGRSGAQKTRRIMSRNSFIKIRRDRCPFCKLA